MKLRLPRFWGKLSGFFNIVLLFGILLAGLFATGYLFPHNNQPLTGIARAADGDSLRINNQRVRIIGIDAPELDQTCLTKQEENWPCGQVSKNRLVEILSAGTITCVTVSTDKYERILATCEMNGQDIGAQMVREGLAISYNEYPADEAIARAAKVGLWAGSFITPRNWRDGAREQESSEGYFQWFWDMFAT